MAAKVIKIEIPIETQDKTDPALGSVTAKMEDLDNAAKKCSEEYGQCIEKCFWI